jgi:hypothetical protein
MLNYISQSSSFVIALWAFCLIFGGALIGFVVQPFLPDHHFSSESRDAAKLGAGLVATLAALILGLLISSTKGTFDQVNTLINEVAANYIHLDKLLLAYGPETTPIRTEVHELLDRKIREIWPEKFKELQPKHTESANHFEQIALEITALHPSSLRQSSIQSSALQLEDQMLQERWMIAVVSEGSVPPLLLLIPVIWITFLTFLYALFSPRNLTVLTVLLCCAMSIAGAIFLIDEMATPMDGTIKVSSAPLRLALHEMEHQ